jgi:hypothetical protein
VRRRSIIKLTSASLFFISWCVAPVAQTSVSVRRQTLSFDDHDIGTSSPQTFSATNTSADSISLSLRITGHDPGDMPAEFSWSSNCLGSIPSKGICDITVFFNPTGIGKDKGDGEDRKATLTLSDGKGQSVDVPLAGKAFQNLSASPSSLEFEAQVGNTTSVSRTIKLTNYTNSIVTGIAVTIAGDFAESHAGCTGSLAPGGECAISITYFPKQQGETHGFLTITANSSSLGRLPRVVALRGVGLNHCKVPRFAVTDPAFLSVFLASAVYFLGLVLVRWHMIAKPARHQIVAQVEVVRSRAIAGTAGVTDSDELKERLERIHVLLDQALYPFKYKKFPVNPDWEGRRRASSVTSPPWFRQSTRIFNALFWTRGQELSSWTLTHEAEVQLVDLLPLERVRAALETAEQKLKDINTPLSLSIADRVRESLASGEALLIERARQLFQQFQALLKPLSVQEAARQVWLADLQRRLNDSLRAFGDWLQKAQSPASTLDACKAQLQDLLKNTEAFQAVATDLARVPETSQTDTSRSSLATAAAFFAKLAKMVSDIQAQALDSALSLGACNDSLSSLTALGKEAVEVSDALKTTAPIDQAKAYKVFIDLCSSQSILISDLTQATVPNPRVTLLVDLLAALQLQKEFVQEVSQADPSAAATDLGTCRDLIRQLASLPPLPPDLVSRINSVILGEVPAPLGRWRALLREALGVIYENLDNSFYQLVSWHNKMMWLVGCALLFMFVLAASLGNAVLLLLGAVGGLLSRLTRTTSAAETDNDYGATWGSLFLSPLTGAFSAWGGILLIVLGIKLNILGAALNLDWCNPFEPVALAIALLFGFLERLFDSVTGQLQDKIMKPPPASPVPVSVPPVAPAPKIISLSPAGATLGKEVQFTVRGSNFQAGATANITRDTGELVPAKLDFKDVTTVVVTCTPTGAKTYKATLTIANQDKQIGTTTFEVAAT